jgi:drug/metabolite transporter (DMT)-like permease
MSLRAAVLLVLAMVLVGSTVVASKLVSEDLPVFLSLAARFALATVLLGVLALAKEGRPRLRLGDVGALALLATTGVVLYNVFLLYGLTKTSATAAGVITATAPAAVAMFSLVLLGDRLSRFDVGAVLLAVAGILIVNVGTASGPEGSDPLVGNMLICGVVICEGLFVVLGKRATTRLSPLQIAAGMSAFAFVFTTPLAAYDAWTTGPSATTLDDWLPVVYLAVAGSLAYLLWYGAIREVDASKAGVFTGVIPVSAVVGSVIVLGESLRPAVALAAVCVVAAIMLTSLGSSPARVGTHAIGEQADEARERLVHGRGEGAPP